MVSRKRRRAGLKARNTLLSRLRGDPKPGFGRRLWTDGHPANKHKTLWTKVNAEIDEPALDRILRSVELSRLRAQTKKKKTEQQTGYNNLDAERQPVRDEQSRNKRKSNKKGLK